MKKVFVLMVLLMLGIFVNLSAQEKYSESYELSADKSTVSVFFVKTTSEKIKTLNVSSRAKYYLDDKNDSILVKLLTNKNEVYFLTDSLIPRWTHLFGKDYKIQRQLEVSWNSDIVYNETGIISVPNKNRLISFILLIYFCLMTIGVIISRDKSLSVVIPVALCVFFIMASHSTMTLFDLIFYSIILILPAFITLFILKRNKNKNISKNNLLVRS